MGLTNVNKGEKYDEKIYEYAESKWRTRCKNAFKKAQEYYEGSSMLDVYGMMNGEMTEELTTPIL